MEYRNHLIEQDTTGYAPKDMMFSIYIDDGEQCVGHGCCIENCKAQVDELLLNDETPNFMDEIFNNPLQQLENLF